MIVVLILIFLAIGLAAASFAAIPLLRGRRVAAENRHPFWLPAGAGLGIVVVGLGIYALLGQPGIALETLTGPAPNDYPALIAAMARKMPDRPNDLEGWTLLGRGYLSLGNPTEAEKALAHAIDIAKAETGNAPAALYASYGEALTEESGEVTKDAEAAFRSALDQNPDDMISRYYLGFALAQRGDGQGALDLWQALLAEAPPDAPWRNQLIDQMAALKAKTGGAAPNPEVMVAQLAGRLAANPNDLDGWVRLIKAYKVLGDADKARAALTKARAEFANKAEAEATLAQSAKENGLN